MMHHPNMHHQAMSGHPPQHLPAHQGMPTHHQMPPHQMHRENRHVTLTRVPLAPSGMSHGHGHRVQSMGMAHHPPHGMRPVHHSVPPQMKPVRRQYVGGGYSGVYVPPEPRPDTNAHHALAGTGTHEKFRFGGPPRYPKPRQQSIWKVPKEIIPEWKKIKPHSRRAYQTKPIPGNLPNQNTHNILTKPTSGTFDQYQTKSTTGNLSDQTKPITANLLNETKPIRENLLNQTKPITVNDRDRVKLLAESLPDHIKLISVNIRDQTIVPPGNLPDQTKSTAETIPDQTKIISGNVPDLTKSIENHPGKIKLLTWKIPEQTKRNPGNIPHATKPITWILPGQTKQIPDQTKPIPEQTNPIPDETKSIPDNLLDQNKPWMPKKTESIPKSAAPTVKTSTTVREPAASGENSGAGDGAGAEAVAPSADEPRAQANSKEKTPMCLVNELARYNKIKHQYRLTSETGPAHKKIFTVTLRLGDTEEYTAEGSSIKRAQHAAAGAALAGTGFPPPPPRPAAARHPALGHPHHRHTGAVMPTVELNALAMKLCQPAVYAAVPPVPAPPPHRPHRPPHYPRLPFAPYQRMVGPALLYRVRVTVGGRSWLGEGGTPQAARHDAAARALHELRPQGEPDAAAATATAAPGQVNAGDNGGTGDASADLLNADGVKSPVSLVHELALKRNLAVTFAVKSERGPPHMRVFITSCSVGELVTEGEGNGKKVSKRRAAERMLAEMRRLWPAYQLRPRLAAVNRPHAQPKKKARNLIKEGVSGGECAGSGGGSGGADNPISRLAVARHAQRARSPQYCVLEERGAARRREFLVQCSAPPHTATGTGPNKKTAKRRAAHNVLLAMESAGEVPPSTAGEPNGGGDGAPESKRKEEGGGASGAGGGAGGAGEVRQPVPGVLLMDYHQRQPASQPAQSNGVSETSATGGAGGSAPGAKDQLMYLSQLLGFTVQFSDFPKRNHGEYLSLVSLSTEPPVMCHGGGASTALSHEQCARAALRALALMGLDAPEPHPPMQSGSATVPAAKPGVINGVSE